MRIEVDFVGMASKVRVTMAAMPMAVMAKAESFMMSLVRQRIVSNKTFHPTNARVRS